MQLHSTIAGINSSRVAVSEGEKYRKDPRPPIQFTRKQKKEEKKRKNKPTYSETTRIVLPHSTPYYFQQIRL